MYDFVQKFLNPGQMVPHSFAGSLLTAKDRVPDERDRRLDGCDEGVRCLEESVESLKEG